jgi:hypothetical protein
MQRLNSEVLGKVMRIGGVLDMSPCLHTSIVRAQLTPTDPNFGPQQTRRESNTRPCSNHVEEHYQDLSLQPSE